MLSERFTKAVKYATPTIVLVLVLVALVLLPRAAAGSQASAAPDVFTCTPTGVAAYTNRVHVRCSTAAPPGGIYYFAVSTANSASASRFLSIFTTAMVTGKTVRIHYTPSDTSGTAFGCLASDCRTATGAEVMQ
jgi:hypothetical protein